MSTQVVDWIWIILGLTKEEALQSELVKEFCMDLINGQLLIINSEKKKFSSIEIIAHSADQSASQEDRLLTK